VSWLYIALLALALAVVVGAEWPRFGARIGHDARRRREREKRKASLRVVPDEADDFAASVERDLAQLPTIEETDRR
jgi:predicted nucleic acid-binding protein